MSISRLLSLLVVLALLVAPVGMSGGAAMAMPQAKAGHCAGMEGPADKQPKQMVDCAMACAAIPALAQPCLDRVRIVAPAQPRPRVVFSTGLDPEAETPPPRFS